jgi:two-component system cell cycle sensor histidine kinase/response regulator CckA
VTDQQSILVVEDEGVVARDIQRSLIDFGYLVPTTAASASEAIQAASEHCPDLVLMDIRIEGSRDGIETAQILRERFHVPIIYLTAYADSATVARAKVTEPYGYLLKPVKANELRSIVEVALYRHKMDQRLRERERWFSTTLHSIADAVVTVDLAGNITFMNPEAETLTGMSAMEAVGRSAHDVLRLLDGHAQALADPPLLRALRGERGVIRVEAGLRNASTGVVRAINASAAPVFDQGRLLGAVMVFRDVTEQKKIQKQLELADRLASLGTMAAGVAHEVNNPLAVVVGNSEHIDALLERHRSALARAGIDLSPEVDRGLAEMAEALRDVQLAGERIGGIVSDLSGFSRPPLRCAGQADVVGAVEWALRTTRSEFPSRAALLTKLDAVPTVVGDEARLGQVFVNLLLNAAQAIAPGSADQNEVSVVTRTDESGCVVIEVRDTGPGIPDHVRAHIFEPFFTTKREGVGTGLGLSISHGIVTSFGGELQVESEVGRGTVFRVVLPSAPAELKRVPAAVVAPPAALRGHILVIEDELMVRRVIERVLRAHDVVSVGSAPEALALIERGDRFDIIFSDLMMPTMSGIELYEELLRRSPDVARRVVFLSGGAITSKAEDFLQSIQNLRVCKPFKVADILDTVQRLLREQTRSEVVR